MASTIPLNTPVVNNLQFEENQLSPPSGCERITDSHARNPLHANDTINYC